jgi:hypothetical protein
VSCKFGEFVTSDLRDLLDNRCLLIGIGVDLDFLAGFLPVNST